MESEGRKYDPEKSQEVQYKKTVRRQLGNPRTSNEKWVREEWNE